MVALSLGATGCSFQKDKPAETPRVTVQQQKVTAQKALRNNQIGDFLEALHEIPQDQINSRLEDGTTLLEIAVNNQSPDAVKALIARGAKPLLPLQGERGTVLDLADKTNPHIAELLRAEVNLRKNEAYMRIQEGRYSGAIQLMRAQYMPLATPLTGSVDFLTLFLSREKSLSVDTAEILVSVLESQPSIAGKEDQLVILSARFSKVRDAVFSLMKRSSLVVSESALNGLLFNSPSLEWASVVSSLKTQVTTVASLASLQKTYLDLLVREMSLGVAPNPTVLESVKQISRDGTFCEECVIQILSNKDLIRYKKDLVKALIFNSSEAPANFVQSLVGKVSADDFQEVVSILPKAFLKTQKEALSANWSLTEYQSLKAAGLQMTSRQAVEGLKRLFKARHQHDAAATETLTALKADWAVAKEEITQVELEEIFTAEFFYVFDSDLSNPDLFNVLSVLKGVPVVGLLLRDEQGQGYYVNPLSLFKFKNQNEQGYSFKIKAPAVLNSLVTVLSNPTENWFLRGPDFTVITHDVIWLSTIDSEEGQLILLPELKNSFVRKVIDKWVARKSYDFDNLTNLLAKSSSSFLNDKVDSRGKYLAALLKSSKSINNLAILSAMITKMKASPQFASETSYVKDFVEYLIQEKDDKLLSSVFEITTAYLTKQNPRFGFALQGDFANYKKFLENADYSKDPLCADHAKQQYAQICVKEADNKVQFGYLNLDVQAKAELDRFNKVTAMDIETIKALLKIKASLSHPAVQSFFAQNPWIESIKFYDGRIAPKVDFEAEAKRIRP